MPGAKGKTGMEGMDNDDNFNKTATTDNVSPKNDRHMDLTEKIKNSMAESIQEGMTSRSS